MDISDYKHKYTVTVRFSEVDMLGVCNNAVYINFFEDARLQYIKAAGLLPDGGVFTDGRLFFIVKNEINYKAHSHYDDTLTVYTRMAYIRNSSFGFRHIIINAETGALIAEGSGVIVHVDPSTGKSITLEEEFINRVKAFDPLVEVLRK